MDNKYLVIKKGGEIVNAEEYLKESRDSGDFDIFVKREALGHNIKIDEQKSDYLLYAQKFGFNWESNADIGFVQYDYRANLIMRLVKEYARKLIHQIGFPIYEIQGSNVFDLSHPVVEAYAKLYGDRLFQFESGKKKVVMSYDASYPQFNLAGKYKINHRHIPFGHFSISDCYRHEQSGECMLLYRQRRFYMPDIHPYFKDVEEAFEWYPKIEKKLLESSQEVNVNYQVVIEVSSDKNWEKYKDRILEIANRLDRNVLVAILRDDKDRYFIVNVDYKIIDKFGQSREICCIQIDVENAKRLDISFIDAERNKINPIIIHAAIPGGIERYIYMLFDDFKKRFPLWLYPAQIRLIPVNDNFVSFCEKLIEKYKDLPVRVEIDDRHESVSKKIKYAHQDIIPFPVVIGEKEKNSPNDIESLHSAIDKILVSSKDKPFIPMEYPRLISFQAK
ncbi:MAG: His/Gly/Thr/Pro-type tRNA ligase C-terminal domain-containing protein [Patescibacteria group bacterium]|nr:His/Gly/Thr/Pro-type tRNA ligase C-terminal domain-containing protein [Patescibacteria group bacterium]MDD5164481.1 His/Gly/Thr/Pro-type tRNA ligase C-terminal domain-containing protein [Patescibacteria group bacterium]MDD5534400.1 His/Gly/Thr/Pro-type tRNA ligase C-terminal domain-containing protein [Patescibacteria group bacterium]